jgi:hypothetical protein
VNSDEVGSTGPDDGDAPPVHRNDARVAAAVAALEALACAGFGALVLLEAVGRGGAAGSAAGTQVGLAVVLAALSAAVAIAFARGRRWPVALFVVVQIIVALIAISEAVAAGRRGQGWTAAVATAALLIAATGIAAAARVIRRT